MLTTALRSRTSIARWWTTLALVASAARVNAQTTTDLPFAPGERFEYTGRAHRGVSASGTMRVEGPTELRGVVTWTLHSDMEGKLGFIRGSDRTQSWIDPEHMTTLRYTSRERHPLTRNDDAVDVFANEGRWSAENGAGGVTGSASPLDELSFLYFLRTLPLADDTRVSVERHFDAARNPTVVTVVGREEIEVGAGRFRAVVVEMRVRDVRRYRGEGVIRVHLSDDSCRLILRLASDVPGAGKATLALSRYDGMRATCTAKID